MVRETVLERTAARALIARLIDAVPSRATTRSRCSTRGWQLKMLEFREKHALEGAIRRLRKNSTTEGMAPFDMFNDVQDHVLKTAQTHIDRVVLEAFVAGVDRTDDADAKAAARHASATSTRCRRSRRTRPGSSSTASSPRPAPSC